MKFDKSILREADIRGVYKTQITTSFAKRLGLVFGSYLRSKKITTLVVGHDNRHGSVELASSLLEGLTSTGVNVIFIGLVTTPMLNFASRKLEVEYGIMVTASHNPACDNGFKLFGKNYQHCDYDELKMDFKLGKTSKTISLKNIDNLQMTEDVTDEVTLEGGHPTFDTLKNVSETFEKEIDLNNFSGINCKKQ